MALVEDLKREWQTKLATELPQQSSEVRAGIVGWLLGENPDRLNDLASAQEQVTRQAMDYRYRILRQRYLGVGPDRAYKSLIQRLGGLFLIRNKVKTWVALSRDRQRTVVDVLQEVIQELLQSDRHMQNQIRWIAQCTSDRRLQNALLLASTEEYCLRPIRNQPLLVFRFVNYLRRTQRGGMTQVPVGDLIRLVSEEIAPDDGEGTVSLLDTQALRQYETEQDYEERLVLRQRVQQEFSDYLAENVEPLAAEWLILYLQGHTQETIAQMLNVPIKQLYRLREKISYHAIRVFAMKTQPGLVASWLEISLKEHSLGLTPSQWQQFLDRLTPEQIHLLAQLKAGKSMETIAKENNQKINQATGEWTKLYLLAQEIRIGEV